MAKDEAKQKNVSEYPTAEVVRRIEELEKKAEPKPGTEE